MTDRILAATRETFRSLRVRNFRLFFVGQAISQAGTWMQSVAIVWVVLELTDDGFALGLATAAQFLPILVLGAWSGALSDRVDKHRLLIATQIAFTVLAAAFSVLLLTDTVTLAWMYVLSAVFGTLTALDNPSRRAFVAELVPLREVANVVGLNSALMTGSRVVGPAIAGVLISSVGADWCFVVNAVTYLAVIAALLRMDRSQLRSPARVTRARGQVREGLRYVWSEPQLRLALVLITVVGTFAFNYQIVLPLLAERTFGGGAGAFTLLFSMLSVGSLLGALVVARRSTTDVLFLARGAFLLSAATCALAAAPSLAVAALLSVPVGYYAIFLISGSNAVVHLNAEPTMRGRALALTAVVFLGSTPIGGPLAGWVSEHVGPRAGLLMGAVATAVAAIWVRSQARSVAAAPAAAVLSPQARVAEPLPS
jgi:MFS family permease